MAIVPCRSSPTAASARHVGGPALVWAVFGEAPTNAGILGGAIVFVAVACNVILGRDPRRVRPLR